MSLKPLPIAPVPEMTALIARAAFRKGNLYMRLRDELGTLYTDEDFANLFPSRGQPGLPAWRLALVTVMQFLENLPDRQAANAVRARIDWKYALGLELSDPGFDYSVLSEFRDRLVQGKAEHLLLDRMLAHFQGKGLVKARGRQRTDSTHVLAAIRVMNRLELVTETLRATLNDLAYAAPDWLHSLASAEWYQRYGQRVEESRLPKSEAARMRFAEQVGQDGFAVLQAVVHPNAPAGLASLPSVQTLRAVWDRHYERTAEGKVRWRAGPELSRAAAAIESPYDTEAKHSSKRDTVWTGYKVHVSETCEPDEVHLITHVHTTVATTQDVACTEDIHQRLKGKALLPGTHLVDASYVDADLLVSSKDELDVHLLGPTRLNPSWQAREGGYDQTRFVVDWAKQQATCPQGKVSAWWGADTAKANSPNSPGSPSTPARLKVRFARQDCACCPQRDKCVRSKTGQARTLVLYNQAQHEALRQARERITSEEGRTEYRKRAGIEGTLSQGVRRSGMRRSRYWGLSKTHLQHVATAAALNIGRIVAHWEGVKPAKTQVSRFARSKPGGIMMA
jgi:transposase